jgi:hypothetical protein
MARKTATATAEKQPDLLGGHQPEPGPKPRRPTTGSGVAQPAVNKGQLAKVERVPAPNALIDQLRQIKDGKDVAIAKEILAMIREEQDRVAAHAFNASMLKAQQQISAISIKRKSYNKHTKSWWAKLEDISKQVDPFIRGNGFTLSYGGGASKLPEHYLVVCDVSHADGQTRRYEMDVGMDHKGPKGEGTKTLAQGSGSSVTYARRFLKCMIFDIQIEGMDNDGNRATVVDGTVVEGDVPLISQKQQDEIVEALEALGKSSLAFCKPWKIEKIADLPAVDFGRAITTLKRLIKEQAGG